MPETKKTILIAEDETAMLDALAGKFKKSGFNVLKAADGERAFEIAMKKKPDLVMLDILMPKKDGITTMKDIRKDKEWGADVPIVILTNLSDGESISEAAAHQVSFLVKTEWQLDEIVKLVKEKA